MQFFYFIFTFFKLSWRKTFPRAGMTPIRALKRLMRALIQSMTTGHESETSHLQGDKMAANKGLTGSTWSQTLPRELAYHLILNHILLPTVGGAGIPFPERNRPLKVYLTPTPSWNGSRPFWICMVDSHNGDLNSLRVYHRTVSIC